MSDFFTAVHRDLINRAGGPMPLAREPCTGVRAAPRDVEPAGLFRSDDLPVNAADSRWGVKANQPGQRNHSL